tara:strand:- start:8642 stop:8956 length:315 start_codon:yes stop_codon:yes gene_type:complete
MHSKITIRDVLEHLKAVQDPELKCNIVDLGLIYDVNIDYEKNNIEIRMTLTSPGCPFGPEIFKMVETVLRSLKFNEKKVVLVWDPPWEPATMASEDVKDKMGIW